MTTDRELTAAQVEVLQEFQKAEKLNNEEFKIWKKTVPLLYDTIQTHALDRPALSLQWLPGYDVSDNKNTVAIKLLIGSSEGPVEIAKPSAVNGRPAQIGKQSRDFLKLVSFSLPSTLAPDFTSFLPNSQGVPIPLLGSSRSSSSATPSEAEASASGAAGSGAGSGSGSASGSSEPAPVPGYQTLQIYNHNGEVNKIKLSPNGTKFLTFDKDGVVHLYDLASAEPLASFKYHKSEGYALEWVTEESFLSGANDSQIALWDITKPSTPIQVYKGHGAAINDISYAGRQKAGGDNGATGGLFISVSDDSTTQIHDIQRPSATAAASNSNTPVIKLENKHIQTAVAFHPELSNLYLSAGRDNLVALHDLRNPGTPIRKFFGHTESVIGVKWDGTGATQDPNVFYSWGLDKRVIQWDLTSLDEEFTYPTTSGEGSAHSAAGGAGSSSGSGPGVGKRKSVKATEDPCMKFIHGGHTSRINDVDIHPKIKGILASAGNDSLLEIWRAKTIFEEPEEEEED